MNGDEPQVIDDVTCLACGCLCDDVRCKVHGGRIVEVERACPKGRDWFLAEREHAVPEATIEGRAAARDEALDRAARLLRSSRAPLVLGLTWASVETVA